MRNSELVNRDAAAQHQTAALSAVPQEAPVMLLCSVCERHDSQTTVHGSNARSIAAMCLSVAQQAVEDANGRP